jgi:hypothetical protein
MDHKQRALSSLIQFGLTGALGALAFAQIINAIAGAIQ